MKFSIIIPAYNEEKYIEKALTSIKNQHYQDHETIVVCNGCTDNTAEVVRKYTNNVYSLEESCIAKARNYGAQKAIGDVLIFLDADSYFFYRDALDNIKNSLDRSMVIATGKLRPDKDDFKHRFIVGIKNFFIRNFNMFYHPTICWKDTFNQVGGYDEDSVPHENMHLRRKMSKLGKIKVLNFQTVTAMRRYDRLGYLIGALFWVKQLFLKDRDKLKKEYYR